MPAKRILVLNPNSNESVTEGLSVSLPVPSGNFQIDCQTLTEGPFGIETDHDIAMVAPLVVERIRNASEYDAYVIACYSDPGLAQCRQMVKKPVFGMQESAVKAAVSFGGRFGVLALSDDSIRRHLLYIRELGFEDQLAAELALDISVDEATNDVATIDKVVTAGQCLVDDYGVSVIILGCAGMAVTKQAAETKLPVPVIEPTQAALQFAVEAA